MQTCSAANYSVTTPARFPLALGNKCLKVRFDVFADGMPQSSTVNSSTR